MQNITVPPSAEVPANCLVHDEEYSSEELERLAKSELSEDEETRIRSLEALRSLLRGETGLRCQNDDLFLLAFLRAKKFDADRAFHLIKGMYTTFGKYWNIFYDFTHEEVKKALEQNSMYILPRTDSEGCTVMMFRMSEWKSDVISVDDLIRIGAISLLHALRSPSTQIAGMRIIVDYKDFSLKQLLCFKPTHMWLSAQILQNTIPLRMRGLHFVNENQFFQYMWIVLRQFFSKKLKERIHFHGKDLKDLHKVVDPIILPAEYEGEQPPFDNGDWRRKIEGSMGYMNHVFSFGYEKYQRPLRRTSTER